MSNGSLSDWTVTDTGTPCGSCMAALSCRECAGVLDRLARLYAASHTPLPPAPCRWGCMRPAVREDSARDERECEGCSVAARRHGRDKSGRPIRMTRRTA